MSSALLLLYKTVPEVSISGKKEISAALIKVSSTTGGSITITSSALSLEQEI
jgi:hypothetical protein